MFRSPKVIARLDPAPAPAIPPNPGSRHHHHHHHGESVTVTVTATASSTVGAEGKGTNTNTKRRPELVLATDHASVQVIDVRTSQVLVSHGIPPRELFTCAPVSVVLRNGQGEKPERFTYWATVHSMANPETPSTKAQIHCLHETSDGRKVYTAKTDEKGGSLPPPRFLRILNNGSTDKQAAPVSLLVVDASGTVRKCTSKLESVKSWSSSSHKSELSSGLIVQDAVVFDENEARTVFFKSRADAIYATASSGEPGGQTRYLAVMELQEQSKLTVSYYALDNRLSEILTLQIPIPPGTDVASTRWNFYAKSGKVYQVTSGDNANVAMIDLTTVVPAIKMNQALPQASSVIRTSPSSIATIHHGSIKLIDLKWGSLVTEIPLEADQNADTQDSQLLAYFSSIGVLIALSGNSVLAFWPDESNPSGESAPKRQKTGTLASALGRGLRGSQLERDQESSKSKLGRKLIRQYSSTRLQEQLDTIFGASKDPLQDSEYDVKMLSALQALETAAVQRRRPFWHITDPELVNYALNQLFVAKFVTEKPTSGRSSLEISRMAPETFRFLLTRGLISRSRLATAIVTSETGGRIDLTSSAVVDALVLHDPSLQALIYYLSSAPILQVEELAFTLRHVLALAQATQNEIEQRSPSNDESSEENQIMDETPVLVNGDVVRAGEDGNIDNEAFAGDWPEPDPQAQVRHNTRSALGSCLRRLGQCSDKEIRQALRKIMSSVELLYLIDLIRIELAGGGWLARTTDEDRRGEDDMSPQSSQIALMAKILNCAVDCLSVSGWLADGGIDQASAHQSAEKISYMVAEVNAALNGIEDSTVLEQVLHEVLLFAKTTGQSEQASSSSTMTSTTTISTTTTDTARPPRKRNLGEEAAHKDALPLGMKRADEVPTTKHVIGGKEVPLSRRHRAWLQSMKVPEYSFERIEIR